MMQVKHPPIHLNYYYHPSIHIHPSISMSSRQQIHPHSVNNPYQEKACGRKTALAYCPPRDGPAASLALGIPPLQEEEEDDDDDKR